MLAKRSVPGRPTNLDNSRTRPTVLAEGAGRMVWIFFSLLYISLFSLFLGDGSIKTEILI